MKVRILGCGTSTGVPKIGNDWGRCDPDEPRNRRLRSSILVESANQTLLVDCGPDLRQQPSGEALAARQRRDRERQVTVAHEREPVRLDRHRRTLGPVVLERQRGGLVERVVAVVGRDRGAHRRDPGQVVRPVGHQ